MSLDLLLINPGASHLTYQGLARDLTAIEPPLWCRLIAGYCVDRGWSVEILDVPVVKWFLKDVADLVEAKAPRLVGMVVYGHQPSASTQEMDGAGAICRAIKARYPIQQIVIAGGHVSALPVRTMRAETVDYICVGEGPVTIERLLAGDSLHKIPGLFYHHKHSELGGSEPPPLLSANDLHGNAWDLLPMDLYRAHNWQCFDGSPRQPYASIYTSLGCPFACSFCCINAPFGGRGYRIRSPEAIIAEVQFLWRQYGVRTLKITDEMFVLKPAHYMPILEGLSRLPYAGELNIWAYARVDTVKPDTLALMRRAGIRWLALGIESGSAHVRDGAEKYFGDSDIRDAVRAIQAAGINVIGNFIFGLPDDTAETMQATLDLALDLKCEFANFYSAMAYPGSRLFAEAKPEDLPAAWSGYSQHSRDCQPLPTATLTSADVLRFRDAAFQRYFTDTAYLDMMGDKFGAGALREIDAMVRQTLRRELLEAA